jgi:hypothetical protein
MTGTLYGTASYNWILGFFFGAGLGAVAALLVRFMVRPPTVEQMNEAVARSDARQAAKARPAVAA